MPQIYPGDSSGGYIIPIQRGLGNTRNQPHHSRPLAQRTNYSNLPQYVPSPMPVQNYQYPQKTKKASNTMREIILVSNLLENTPKNTLLAFRQLRFNNPLVNKLCKN